MWWFFKMWGFGSIVASSVALMTAHPINTRQLILYSLGGLPAHWQTSRRMSVGRVSRFSASRQFGVEKVGSGVVGTQPTLVAQEAMYFVGKDQVLVVNSLPVQCLDEPHGFREGHIAVIVAVNQQHGRAPRRHRTDGRGSERRRQIIGGGVECVEITPAAFRETPIMPIMHAVQVDTGGEQIRVARQPQGRHIAAVAAAP